MITKAPLGAKIQTTFLHSTIGIQIIESYMKHVARIGMSKGTGMEMEPSPLFVKKESKHYPSMSYMMKVANVTDIDALTADTGKLKKLLLYTIDPFVIRSNSSYIC